MRRKGGRGPGRIGREGAPWRPCGSWAPPSAALRTESACRAAQLASTALRQAGRRPCTPPPAASSALVPPRRTDLHVHWKAATRSDPPPGRAPQLARAMRRSLRSSLSQTGRGSRPPTRPGCSGAAGPGGSASAAVRSRSGLLATARPLPRSSRRQPKQRARPPGAAASSVSSAARRRPPTRPRALDAATAAAPRRGLRCAPRPRPSGGRPRRHSPASSQRPPRARGG